MSNRIPKDVNVTQSSVTYKNMERGEFLSHVFKYKDNKNEEQEIGLVIWKDRKPVLCMTNHHNTGEEGECHRRTKDEGIVKIRRPKVIEYYNTYMGGVDLADKKRLHANSTIMGSNRWWLKLFYYNLDVGTANALILYNLAVHTDKNNHLNITEYKKKLVLSLVGSRILKVVEDIHVAHELRRNYNDERHMCAYCLVSGKHSRTRYVCANPNCNLPLCSVGNGRSEKDCFSLSHANDEILNLTKARNAAMLLKTNKRFKKN